MGGVPDCMMTSAGIPLRDSPPGHFRSQGRMQVHMYIVRYCCPILTRITVCRKMLAKLPSIKFHENLFSGFRGVNADKCTDMAKLIGVFLQLLVATAPKIPTDDSYLICRTVSHYRAS
jgi:hypothetical protein